MMQGLLVVIGTIGLAISSFASDPHTNQKFVQIAAQDKHERSSIANFGVSIETVRTDSVWAFANDGQIAELKKAGHVILGAFDAATAKGGHETMFGFPPSDTRFHDYAKMNQTLADLTTRHNDLSRLVSIGKTIEGRDMWAVHLNTSPDALTTGQSNKPGAIFMGNHHAREHLSAEIPLMLLQHLLTNRDQPAMRALLESRDIWIIPMVNPDGVEWDIASGRYRSWRKNRRNNGDGTYGVDLNRNYGYGWGTGGSSRDPNSDVYMGRSAFSEPETQAIRDFVSSHLNTKVLLSFHTFSELVLWPWGGKNDPVNSARDRQVFEKMGRTMAGWNGYTPEQASDLYVASGDTTDWAYGTHGIFAFTFELTPKSIWEGGFYPGASVIDRVFDANLRPCLYLLDLADDPYRSISAPAALSPAARYELNPMALLFPYRG